MPLRSLLRYLANNERLVQKIADSYPVRRAAQLAISMFYKGKERMAKMDPQDVNRIQSVLMSFIRRFNKNVKEGIEDAKKQLKK